LPEGLNLQESRWDFLHAFEMLNAFSQNDETIQNIFL
jgi:hypothetical protein